jgi:hypothetical protein
MSSCSFVVGLSTSQPENQSESATSETVSPQDSNTSPRMDVRPYICMMLQSAPDYYKKPVELQLTME